jgi:sigma-B regulation protein RsbU (phosphoserine phosphatase)
MVDPINASPVDRRILDRRGKVVKGAVGPDAASSVAARVLVEHLFEQHFSPVSGIDIGTAHVLSDDNARVGGDLVDIYQFNNGSVAISIADISGKGIEAAARAALVKYGLRAYVSSGLTPAQVLRNLNVLYLETSAYDSENRDSFVSVFLGIIDPEHQVMTYASGGHDPVMFMSRDGDPISLPPTAPIVGVLEESQRLFHQKFVSLRPGTSTLILGTDGLTEARSPAGTFIAREQIMARIASNRARPAQEHADDLLQATFEFCGQPPQDDVAIVVARFN